MAIPARFNSHRLGLATADVTVQIYLDYACPFSKKAFDKIYDEVYPHLEKTRPGKVQIIFMHVIQPWHPQSTSLHEAAIAVERLNPAAFWPASRVLFGNMDKFSSSKMFEKSRKQINEEIADLLSAAPVSVDRAALLALLDPTKNGEHAGSAIGMADTKWWTRYHRTVGVHMTPTLQVNGIVNLTYGSAWTLEQYLEQFV